MPMGKSLLHLSSSPIMVPEEEATMKQGIVTILRSDCERTKAVSIRRTLSADMSSKKWLEQNGFFNPMIASSEELVVIHGDSSSFSSQVGEEYEKVPGQDDVWLSIQSQKVRNEVQKQENLDVWGSILTQKSETSVNIPPPYVHPLVKRSTSNLSEKSLGICTENLGSETGSDGFSSYPPSENLSDADEDKEDRQRVVQEEIKELNPFEDLHVSKYRKSPVRPFPPPLSSIAGGDGASLHMHSHRENGRLVLEAVSVPPKKHFHAHRRDGRLVLTLISSPTSQENELVQGVDNMEEVDEDIKDGGGDGGYQEEEVVEKKFVMEQNMRSLMPCGITSVHKSGLVMKKLMALCNKNPTWSNKFKKAVDMMETEEVEEELPVPLSLPPPQLVAARPVPPPPPPAAASFNAYEYFWRSKTTVSGGFINPMITTTPLNNNKKVNGTKAYEHQDFVTKLRGCKEPKRSLQILVNS
ncbi:hypothetical protein Pfo_017898 [Paulownia fortunei]|nr:hypothetical protein Pfo_017898 [Paulownia fortunei]